MNNLKKSAHLILFALFAMGACKKNGTPVPDKNADVYIVGSINAANGNSVAAYWKNGVIVKLADSAGSSSAKSISVNGSDVYIAGFTTVNGKIAAALWKNGALTTLSNGGSGLASANGIVISNNNVYVAGNAVNGDDISAPGFSGLGATYWKNTAVTKLPDSSAFGHLNGSSANGIAVDGNDVYISGNIAGVTASGPAYWKNGIATSLSDGTFYEKATCIATDGVNVYVAGATHTNQNIAYWKNGIVTVLPDKSYGDGASAILVKGDDIYLTGVSFVATAIVATYWKNGISTKFTNGIPATNYQGYVSVASGIAVNNSDVYVSGYVYNNSKPGPVYWKNGIITYLAKDGNANGIAVIPH